MHPKIIAHSWSAWFQGMFAVLEDIVDSFVNVTGHRQSGIVSFIVCVLYLEGMRSSDL